MFGSFEEMLSSEIMIFPSISMLRAATEKEKLKSLSNHLIIGISSVQSETAYCNN